jgi:hypothetical protein
LSVTFDEYILLNYYSEMKERISHNSPIAVASAKTLSLDGIYPMEEGYFYSADLVETEYGSMYKILNREAPPARLQYSARPDFDVAVSLRDGYSLPHGGYEVARFVDSDGEQVQQNFLLAPVMRDRETESHFRYILEHTESAMRESRQKEIVGLAKCIMTPTLDVMLHLRNSPGFIIKADGTLIVNPNLSANEGETWQGVNKYTYSLRDMPKNFECTSSLVAVDGNDDAEEHFYVISGLDFASRNTHFLNDMAEGYMRYGEIDEAGLRLAVNPYIKIERAPLI